MSDDPKLFQPPQSYQNVPKNLPYNVPVTQRQPHRPAQIFPWEGRVPKATRVFPDDPREIDGPSASSPGDRIGHAHDPSSKDKDQTPRNEQPVASARAGPWQSLTRGTNVWDEDPAITRYMDAIQQRPTTTTTPPPRNSGISRVQPAPATTTTTTTASRGGTGTAATITEGDPPHQQQQRGHPTNVTGAVGRDLLLPSTQDLPSQEDWVGFTASMFLRVLRLVYSYWAFTESIGTTGGAATAVRDFSSIVRVVRPNG